MIFFLFPKPENPLSLQFKKTVIRCGIYKHKQHRKYAQQAHFHNSHTQMDCIIKLFKFQNGTQIKIRSGFRHAATGIIGKKNRAKDDNM